jgi:hypothetical protein
MARWLCGVPNILIWNGRYSARVVMFGKAENRSWMLRWERDGGVRLYAAFCCGHEVDACVRPVFFVDIRVLPTNCCGLPPSLLLLTSVASLVTSRGIVVWLWAWVRNCFPSSDPSGRPWCPPSLLPLLNEYWYFFLLGTVAGTWSSPVTSIYCRG